MFIVMIDRSDNNFAFTEITKGGLIPVEKLNCKTNVSQNVSHETLNVSQNRFETFISNETDDEKLIEYIKKELNKKG